VPDDMLSDARLSGYLVVTHDSVQVDTLASTIDELREAVGLGAVAA